MRNRTQRRRHWRQNAIYVFVRASVNREGQRHGSGLETFLWRWSISSVILPLQSCCGRPLNQRMQVSQMTVSQGKVSYAFSQLNSPSGLLLLLELELHCCSLEHRGGTAVSCVIVYPLEQHQTWPSPHHRDHFPTAINQNSKTGLRVKPIYKDNHQTLHLASNTPAHVFL